MSWRSGGNVITSSKRIRSGIGSTSVGEIELEDAPAAVEQRRMKLAEPAGVGVRGLAGMQERLGRTGRSELEVKRVVERLDGATCGSEATLDDAADAPALLRQRPAARQVDACQLEQGDAGVAGVDVHPRSRDQPLEQRRAEDRLLAAHRIGQAQRRRVGSDATRLHV